MPPPGGMITGRVQEKTPIFLFLRKILLTMSQTKQNLIRANFDSAYSQTKQNLIPLNLRLS
jgi:hypothetical protein